MSKFIAASRQATELDKTRLLLETRIKEVKEKSKVSLKRTLVLTIFRKGIMS